MEAAYQQSVLTDDPKVIHKRDQEVYDAGSITQLWKNLSDAIVDASLAKHHEALGIINVY